MPLEISEIGVKIAVGDGSPPEGEPESPAPRETPRTGPTSRFQQIVSAAVQRVLATLRAVRGR